ncbi:MAG: hypothetical protein NVSMB44_34300 [Ktedonobacteraceae bacterium]
MNNSNHEDSAYSDDEFAIVDLDAIEQDQADSARRASRTRPRLPTAIVNQRIGPWVRRGIVSLTVISSIALFALLWPYLQLALFHNQDATQKALAGPGYETSLDLSLAGDILGIHASSPGGSSLAGLRDSTGAQLWRYNGAIIGKPISVQGVLYVLTPGSVDALQIQTGTLLWRHKNSTNARELLVADDMVYLHAILASSDKNKEPGSPEIVSALSASNGQLMWQYTTRGFNQSLQAKDGFVYIYTTRGQQALRASDGHLLWQHPNGIFVPIPPFIGDGVAYVYSTQQASGSTNSQVWSIDAVHASDGKLLWQHSANGIVIHREDGIAYIYRQQDERIEALQERDGKTLWRYQMSGGDQPLFDHGVVYVYTTDGPAALRASDGMPLWQSKVSVDTLHIDGGMLYSYSPQNESVVALRASNGELLWQHPAPADSTLTVTNGQVYIRRTLASAALEALRGSDGALLWQRKTNGDVLQVYNGRVYTNSQADGTLDALNINNGKLLWHYQAPHH